MTLYRRDAKRDENEPEVVKALRACGLMVTCASVPKAPDLIVVRPSEKVSVYTVESAEEAVALAPHIDDVALIEVKMPGKKLNEGQEKWHKEAKGEG